MDYGELLRGAWRVGWRHKYLWLLGLFASEGGCTVSGGSPNFRTTFGGSSGSDAIPTFGSESGDWLIHNWPVLAALVVTLFLLGLALWVISVIATGGLIAGSDAAYAGAPSGLGAAWSAGIRNFWRLLGMWLLVLVVVLLIILLIMLAIVLPLVFAFADGARPGTGAIIAIVLVVLALILLAIPVAIVAQVVLTWGSRALVLEGTGPLDSIRRGWRVFRANIGTSLVVWLINVGVSIAAGIALLVPLALLAIPVGVIVYRAGSEGMDVAVWAIIALVGVVAVAILALFKAWFTTFGTAYWTIAYRRLVPASGTTGEVAPRQSPTAPLPEAP